MMTEAAQISGFSQDGERQDGTDARNLLETLKVAVVLQVQLVAQADRAAGRVESSHPARRGTSQQLPSLPAQGYLRPGRSINALKRVAASVSDTETARRMQQAKNTLFEQIRRPA